MLVQYSRTSLERPRRKTKMWFVKTGGLLWQVQLYWNVGPSAKNVWSVKTGGLSWQWCFKTDFTVLCVHEHTCSNPFKMYRTTTSNHANSADIYGCIRSLSRSVPVNPIPAYLVCVIVLIAFVSLGAMIYAYHSERRSTSVETANFFFRTRSQEDLLENSTPLQRVKQKLSSALSNTRERGSRFIKRRLSFGYGSMSPSPEIT